MSSNLQRASSTPRPLSHRRRKHSLPQLRGRCGNVTQLHVKTKTVGENLSPLRPCIKYNNWTVSSPESHPLSQSQCCSQTSLSNKNKVEKFDKCTELEHSAYDEKELKMEKSTKPRKSTNASTNASQKCSNRTVYGTPVDQTPPLSSSSNDHAMDRITRYCTVDLDNDYVANFNFDFLNDDVL